MINDIWDKEALLFLKLSNQYEVRMLMVGGGAVNFHGYQRHSADVDFWIDTSEENLARLVLVLKEMGYKIDDFPESVKKQEQNISLKFSPLSIFIELITCFSINKNFDEAFNESEFMTINDEDIYKWRVLNYEDLIISKIKSGRPKDLLDIQELQKIKNQK
ncbi:MAG: DUF6036 family nucleotidyltransferase [Crocinitomicaceae bacterium]|jgi:hypothetical protein